MPSFFFSGNFFWIQGSLLRTEDIKEELRAKTISPSLIDFFYSVTEMKVLRDLKGGKVFTLFFSEPSVFAFAW